MHGVGTAPILRCPSSLDGSVARSPMSPRNSLAIIASGVLPPAARAHLTAVNWIRSMPRTRSSRSCLSASIPMPAILWISSSLMALRSSSWGWAALLVEAAYAVAAAMLDHLAETHPRIFEMPNRQHRLRRWLPGDLLLGDEGSHVVLDIEQCRSPAIASILQCWRHWRQCVRVHLRLVLVHVLSPLFVGAVAENEVHAFPASLRLRAAGGVIQIGVVGVLPPPVDQDVLVPVAAHGLVPPVGPSPSVLRGWARSHSGSAGWTGVVMGIPERPASISIHAWPDPGTARRRRMTARPWRRCPSSPCRPAPRRSCAGTASTRPAPRAI